MSQQAILNPVVVFKSTKGPMNARVTGLDPKTGRVAVVAGTQRGVLKAEQVLSANVDAWKVGLRWAPKYWRTGLNEARQDWGDIPEDRRANEQSASKDPFDDVPETLSLKDFPGTPGPDHGKR